MPERYDDHEYWNDWQCEDDHADYLEDEYQRRTRDTAWYLLSFDPPDEPNAALDELVAIAQEHDMGYEK